VGIRQDGEPRKAGQSLMRLASGQLLCPLFQKQHVADFQMPQRRHMRCRPQREVFLKNPIRLGESLLREKANDHSRIEDKGLH
jgi:hypothetical protein